MENDNLLKIFIEDEMKTSYLDYSMSVIVGRALPDVRDGLKPVHRRILYSMNENGMHHNKPFKKSTRIVGDVMSKYHPHGDAAIYQSLVRLAQVFNIRYPLIDGQGNFGSVDGDSAASSRYTEVKMSKLSSEIIEDIDKETVNFRDNFDSTLKEPEVLPAKVSTLLLNGSSGIAVGMATNIPPHNLGEVVDATLALIHNPEISVEELMFHIKGPDFPTGGFIYGEDGLKQAYITGKGKIKIRGKASVEALPNGAEAIIITDLPYQVNKALLIQNIAELARDKKIEGISELRDESDMKGNRIYIEVKKSEDAEIILNKIYKYTSLEVAYGIIMLALDKNIPKVMNLKQIIVAHINHRFEVLTRRTKYDLDRAEKRHHIMLGFKIAIANIDEVVAIIKSSSDTKDAAFRLTERFQLSEEQVKAVLEMRLQKLTSLEVTKLSEEIAALEETIDSYKFILSKESEIYRLIELELKDLKEKYADSRKTKIVEDIEQISLEDMVSDDDVLITITNKGYVKRMSLDNYKAQKRGGRGYIGQNLNDEDFVRSATYAKNLDTLLIFSNKGKVYSVKVYQIPELSRVAKGRLFSNILPLSPLEKVKSIIKIRDIDEDKQLAFVTRKGIIKKTSLSLYKNINKSGIIAIKLKDEDDLINVLPINPNSDVFLATKKGFALRFSSSKVKFSGRSSVGVKGINLRDGDIVVGAVAVSSPDAEILTISAKGYGKKSKISEYKLISRGRKGVINMKVIPKIGDVVSVEDVEPNDEIILITSTGGIIRTPVKGLSTIKRATQGVRMMKLATNEIVVDISKLRIEEDN